MTDLRHQPPIPKRELAKVKRPEKASQTFLSKWDTCHRSAFLYLKHRGGPQTHSMARGEAFHAFVERATAMLRDSGETDMPPEIAKDLMSGLISERRDLVLPEFEQNALRAMAWNWANATEVDPDKLVGIEQMIELEVGDWTIRGKLDFAEIMDEFGYALVRDYKTSLAVPSQDEITNGAKSFQGRFYALLMLFGIPEGESLPLGTGLNECRVELAYPRYTNSETGALVGRETTWDRDQLTDFRRSLETHLEHIDQSLEDGLWQASPGSHCAECPARRECPIPEQHHEIDVIESVEEAEQVAELHYTRDLANRRLKKSLRAFTKDHGAPIFMGDMAYDFREQESRVVDWDAANGGPIDPAKHVSLRTSTVFDRRKVRPEEREERG